MKSLPQLYEEHKGKVSDKWSLYLGEYDRLFSPYRDQPVRLLEIGVQNGGSLDIWSKYFKSGEKFVGCDINPNCAKLIYEDSRIAVVIGDANTDETEKFVLQESNHFDLIIDDGSHTSGDIVKSFARYFSHLKDGGLFVAEDLHCSYWKNFEGGLYYPYSSMSFFKRLADVINYEHWGVSKDRRQVLSGITEHFSIDVSEEFLSWIHSIEFVNSMCIVRKFGGELNRVGERLIVGQQEDVIVGQRENVAVFWTPPDERQNYWSSLEHSPDESFENLMSSLKMRDEQINDLNENLNSVFESTSWQITRPLRWLSIQVRLVKEYGLATRIHAFVRKGVRVVARQCVEYVRARPELRVRLYNLSVSLGLNEWLHAFYKKIQGRATDGIPNLRELVVTSYEAWSEHFDTPSMEVMDQLATISDSRSPVLVVARFDKMSEQYAVALAQRLVDSVGPRWTAVFLFSTVCNTVETTRKIGMATNHDSRIVFDPSVVKENAEIAILIEGGALPRSHALHVFADTLHTSPDVLMAYSDEDDLSNEGRPSDPWFKPKFSQLLVSQGVLLGRMLAFRVAGAETAGILEKLLSDSGDLEEFARDYAVALGEKRVSHIPHVLFHNAFARGTPIVVKLGLPEVWPKATIVIPTKDRWDLLGPCLESLWLSDWPSELLDVVVVDNGFTDSETLTMLKKLKSERKIRVIRDARQFNWSRLNNLAAHDSDGELLVFLNNDTEVDDPAWLKKLAVHALRPGVGAVGCKLLYPDRTVQHGGVIAGIQGVAGHAHLFIQADEGGYCNLANLDHEVSAVTGACLAVTRKNFELAGGFNEDFRVAFNDIVFCFTLHTLGLRNVYVSDPLLIHHESKSRGFDDTPEKLALQQAEARRAWGIHADLMRDDPFYSPNLSLWKPYELAFAPRRRAAWDDRSNRPLRVMMLSVTHAVGHGVPVVLALQAEALVKHGYEVIVAGPRSSNDFPYPGCARLELQDPLTAATLAADLSVDLIMAHTPPFFGVARWTGAFPPVISYDYGEPPPEWFPDAEQRRAVLADKDQSLVMATAVYAISNAIVAESRTPVHGIIPLGNAHLGQWSVVLNSRRKRVRADLGWGDRFVVLNVCRFHAGERSYKGIDNYIRVRETLEKLNSDVFSKTIFVLCGKGSKKDVDDMSEQGLIVHANVTDEEMFDLYCAADAYANFSKWEGYNLGVGQALAMGLPTIASDIPAHREFEIKVTNNIENAAEWLIQISRQNQPRSARVRGWDEAFAKLVQVVESVTAESKC